MKKAGISRSGRSIRVVPEQLAEFFGRHRHAEVVTLHLVAVVLPQEFDLFFGLDAFGNHFESEVVPSAMMVRTIVASS